jgi:hypothetical protein
VERGAPPGRDMALSLLAVTVPQHDELACSRRWRSLRRIARSQGETTYGSPMERSMGRSIGGFDFSKQTRVHVHVHVKLSLGPSNIPKVVHFPARRLAPRGAGRRAFRLVPSTKASPQCDLLARRPSFRMAAAPAGLAALPLRTIMVSYGPFLTHLCSRISPRCRRIMGGFKSKASKKGKMGAAQRWHTHSLHKRTG